MATTVPTPCVYGGMAQRGNANETVLLNAGNPTGYSNYLNTTYTYAGSTNAWTNVSNTFNLDPKGPLPVRAEFAMAYDGTNVMVFGGKGGSSTAGMYQDTWTWNGTVWANVSPAGTPGINFPTGRFGCKAAYCSGLSGALLWGGTYATGYLAQDTWLWNGTTWAGQNTTANPTFRKGHCMAASASSVFVFGGEDGKGTLFNDGWTFSGGNWSKVTMTNVPSVRSYASMCYDIANSVYVMFGGKNQYNYLDETWTFNPSSGAWALITSNASSNPNTLTQTAPYGKFAAQMCWDNNSGQSILFGGWSAGSAQAASETFGFNASTKVWTKYT